MIFPVLTSSVFKSISRVLSGGALFVMLVLSMVGSGISFVSAQNDPSQAGFQVVPCDGVTVKCDYNQFIIGIQRIIKACILFAIPLSAGVFGWFGIKMMTAGGDVKAREEAKKAMFMVLKGMLLMLSAWYVVDLALGGLLSADFKSGLQH
ncbi:MAG: hypothetical protein RLZZ347_56 [Candidatus Parcubacteria bacterium]